MSHSIVQNNGWNVISPDDMAAGTPARAINDNFIALAEIINENGSINATTINATTINATTINATSFVGDGSGLTDLPNLLSTSTTTALVGAIFANGTTVFSDADITTDGHGDLSIAGQNGTARTTPSLLVMDSYENSVAIGDGGASGAAISVASGSTSLDGGLISTDGSGTLTLAGSLSIGSSAIETVVNGTSGHITWSQPILAQDANCFSVVAIRLTSYINAATKTITFVVPFSRAPVALVNSNSLAITLAATTITIPVCAFSTNATILLIGL